MMRIRVICGSLITITLIAFLTSCVKSKPRVLIIGDSISIGYTPFVKESLSGKAIVIHNEGNAQDTRNGLEKIEQWLGDTKWDIIQINWGLWDLCYRNPDSKTQGNRDKINGKITTAINEYVSNLDSIIKLIRKKSNAKIVFVTTTVVPGNEIGRFSEDVIHYNEATKKVMFDNDILVNDIYEKSIQIHKTHGKGSNDVHYSEEGYKELSILITKFLEQEINNN